MLHHGFAKVYASHLRQFLNKDKVIVAEFGVLKGTGLALWCDLFPNSRVIGLDIDLSHFSDNLAWLVQRGAFKKNEPEVHEYDQLLDSEDRIAEILEGQSLDIVVDDGHHSVNSVFKTWQAVKPHLSKEFKYFIEDCPEVASLREGFEPYELRSYGLISIIQPTTESAGKSIPFEERSAHYVGLEVGQQELPFLCRRLVNLKVQEH